MKAVILAGGFGTRIAEYTDLVPKPMVHIGGRPLLVHIMSIYAKFGVKDFVVAGGYKADVIKKFFLDMASVSSDFTVNLRTGGISIINRKQSFDWNVTIVDTGLDTMTGGRLARLRGLIGEETFFLTYGDGLSDVNVMDVLAHHQKSQALITTTAVRPVARFGEIKVENGLVKSFKEKPQLEQGWINGGFFVVEPSFIDLIQDDSTVLESTPMEEAARQGKLGAFLHEGFWQCMDTKRDRDLLDDLWSSGDAPWL